MNAAGRRLPVPTHGMPTWDPAGSFIHIILRGPRQNSATPLDHGRFPVGGVCAGRRGREVRGLGPEMFGMSLACQAMPNGLAWRGMSFDSEIRLVGIIKIVLSKLFYYHLFSKYYN